MNAGRPCVAHRVWASSTRVPFGTLRLFSQKFFASHEARCHSPLSEQRPYFFQILRRIEPEGTLRRIGSAQARVLASLLETDRLNRLSEYEAISGSGDARAYRLAEMLGDVRHGIWGELSAGRVSIDPFRRSLQRAYVSQADMKVNPSSAIIITTGPPSRGARPSSSSGANSDVRALMRGELIELDAALRSAQGRAANRTTRLHMMDMRNEIRRILDPER